MSSLREVAEAAVVEAVATVLHDHGPMNGQVKASQRWQDCPNGEIHGSVASRVTSTPTVLALLGVVVAASEGCGCPVAAPHRRTCRVTAALARLPEEARP